MSTYFSIAHASTTFEADLAKTVSLYGAVLGSLLIGTNIPEHYHQAPTVNSNVQIVITM